MANTRDTMGGQACLDALIADTLTSFEDDGVIKVGNRGFYAHSSLTNVKLSQCKTADSNSFAYCANLETVDMLGTGYIYGNAFEGDSSLKHLVMRGSSMTTLFGNDIFARTPIEGGVGAIYVDSSLLNAYKANANWNKYFITTLDKYPLSDFSTIEDDWATIISKAEAGTASESYSIGDTKLIDLGTEGKVFAQIAAFGVDPLASDGTKTAGITFVTKDFLATLKVMNTTATTNGGWSASAMRSYLANTILPLFPSTVKDAIKEVRKYSDTYESAIVHDQETADKLWIPSAREVFGGTSYEQTGPIYSNLFPDAVSRVKYNKSGSAYYWWLRSASSATSFRYVHSSGSASGSSASYATGVVIGFCI